jgi:hypothetical protein
MEALEMYKSEEWTRIASCMVSSQYVADMRNAVSDLEKRRMDSVIAQWGALTIGENSCEENNVLNDVPLRAGKALE